MPGIVCPIHHIFPRNGPKFPSGTMGSRAHTTFVESLHVFPPPFSVIRALISDLLVRLQRTLPLWELVRMLIRAGGRSSKPGPVETGAWVSAFRPGNFILVTVF